MIVKTPGSQMGSPAADLENHNIENTAMGTGKTLGKVTLTHKHLYTWLFDHSTRAHSVYKNDHISRQLQ